MLTLHIPGEEDPRPLEVKLLEAGENNENRSMTLDELRCIFQDPANGQPQDVEEEEEEQPEDAPEEHAAAMEALNVVPEHANDAPGDGDQGEVADENDVQMADQDGGEIELEVGERLHAPVFPEVPDIGLEGPQNDDDWLLDEDLHFEPAPRVQALLDEVPVYSSSSSSSRHLPGEAGLHTTPSEVRQMIPQRPGAKLQHKTWKRATDGTRSGWQAWISPSLPSRWFGYGEGMPYKDRSAAMNAALEWLWQQDRDIQ